MRLLVAAVIVIIVCVSCGSSDSEIVTPTSTIAVTSQNPSIRTPTPVVQPALQVSATSTSEPVVTATAAATPVANAAIVSSEREGDVTGIPFSTEDVRLMVEGEYGYSFWLVKERAPLCPSSSVVGRPYWSASLAGSDFGPVFVLWVYPDIETLRLDWTAVNGQAPVPIFDCELPSGFVYWNENLVLAFDVWLGLGQPLPLAGHPENPNDMPAITAFLSLER